MSTVPMPDSLDEAVYQLVYQSEVPAKALASGMGVRYGYLAEAANPNREETAFQARFIVPATLISKNDVLMRFLCHRVGGVFVRLEREVTSDELTARTLKEFGDYLHSVAESKADGRVTLSEAARVRKQAHEVIAALLAHVLHVEERAQPANVVGMRERA